MRYRIDPITGEMGAPASHEAIVVTVVFTLLIGIGLCCLGIWGRQPWIVVMAGVLVILSVIYLAAMVLGIAS